MRSGRGAPGSQRGRRSSTFDPGGIPVPCAPVRLVWLLTGLAVLVLIPFFLVGEEMMARFGGSGPWLQDYGRAWGWLAGLGLLTSDLVLPVPATAVISALGFVYGAGWGALIGASGSFLSGTLAYEACRGGGPRVVNWLLGPADLAKATRIFAGTSGGWLIALSRWLPLLPEMACCMAGLSRMPRRRFFTALACGCGPMAMVFATIGSTGTERPGLALGLSALAPALLYGAAVRWLKHHGGRGQAEPKSTAEGLEEGKGS